MQMVHHRLSHLEWRNMRSDLKKLTWATIYVQKITPKYIYPDINTNKHINLVILSMKWSWQNSKGYCSHKCSNLCTKVSLYTLDTKLTIFVIDYWPTFIWVCPSTRKPTSQLLSCLFLFSKADNNWLKSWIYESFIPVTRQWYHK